MAWIKEEISVIQERKWGGSWFQIFFRHLLLGDSYRSGVSKSCLAPSVIESRFTPIWAAKRGQFVDGRLEATSSPFTWQMKLLTQCCYFHLRQQLSQNIWNSPFPQAELWCQHSVDVLMANLSDLQPPLYQTNIFSTKVLKPASSCVKVLVLLTCTGQILHTYIHTCICLLFTASNKTYKNL